MSLIIKGQSYLHVHFMLISCVQERYAPCPVKICLTLYANSGYQVSLCNCVVCQSERSIPPFFPRKHTILRLPCSGCASAQTGLDFGCFAYTIRLILNHDTTSKWHAQGKKCFRLIHVCSEICMYTQPGGTKICIR